MKIQIFRQKQLSFLPIGISLNGSPFKPLMVLKLTEFDTDSAKNNIVLNLYGLKREFVLPPVEHSELNLGMSFKLDKNQKLLLFLSIVGVIFLLFVGILNKNFTQILVASAAFITIPLFTIYYAMQLHTIEKPKI